MNKRGAEINFTFIMLILALIFLVSSTFFGNKVFGQVGGTLDSVSPTKLKAEAVDCRGQSSFPGGSDFDGDKLKDFCDPCVTGPETEQSDDDGMADGCDVAPKLPDTAAHLACCGDAQKAQLEKALAAYNDKAKDTQAAKTAALVEINKYCINTIRTLKPFQCCAGKSCPI